VADLFVSYARADKARVAPLVSALEAQGWSVWWDPEIAPGQEFDALIASQLEQTRAVIVVWTPASVQSRWVRGEARVGADRGVLAPVRFDNAVLPIDARAIHTIDLDRWGENVASPEFQQLARAVGALLNCGQAPLPASVVERAPARTGASICVLPFANMSGDSEQEYFSDGISEDIITDLSKVSSLGVIARNSAFAFKGKSIDIKQVARQLEVTHVLEGSVRKAGNRVRITAQLIDGATNSQLWADRFDRDLDDIFALQDEISQAIVGALKVRLLPEEKKAIARRGTESVEAYNVYLMARQEYLSVSSSSANPSVLVRLCQKAVEIDPSYAEAWALLARGQALQGRWDGAGPSDAALESAERALALNGQLAEAHAARAYILYNRDRIDEASAEAELALRLDPESPEAILTAALVQFQQGRIEEAARHFERLVQLLDQDTTAPMLLVTCYHAFGRRQDLHRTAETLLARAEKVLAGDRNNGRMLGRGFLALAALGQEDRAKEWMNRALLIDPDNMNMRYNFACSLSTFLQDKDAALEMLSPVFQKMGTGTLSHAKVDPDLDSVRDDPRFQAMVAEAEARLAASAPTGAG
jgi:adenylate cyclase